jgi:hypothetical protein
LARVLLLFKPAVADGPEVDPKGERVEETMDLASTNFIVTLIIGGIVGWLASILMRANARAMSRAPRRIPRRGRCPLVVGGGAEELADRRKGVHVVADDLEDGQGGYGE